MERGRCAERAWQVRAALYSVARRGRRMRLSAWIAALAALGLAGAAAAQAPDAVDRRIARILKATPLIDGHNDLPWEIRENYDSWRKPLDLARDTASLPDPLQTDIARLRRGGVGAQFWSVWIPGETKGDE